MSDLPLQETAPIPSTLNLILTGFMGTGKSTVGSLVAADMGRVFYDMDAVIEQRTGMAISGIFAQESEPYFRAIERGLCYEMALQQNLVVATGGGALVDPNNYEVMSKTGVKSKDVPWRPAGRIFSKSVGRSMTPCPIKSKPLATRHSRLLRM
jgi:hypothetical protein